jgi:hypothetical protein
MQEYPKWVKVDHDGDPSQPGYILCTDEAEELALTAKEAKPKSK